MNAASIALFIIAGLCFSVVIWANSEKGGAYLDNLDNRNKAGE